MFVLKRPGVDEFLERVAKLYEVIIFTASLPQYANPLLDLVRHRIFLRLFSLLFVSSSFLLLQLGAWCLVLNPHGEM